MSLAELVVEDLRCLHKAELHLHPGLNLIWGGNGAGKTSLLEAIFLLGRGRSFRTRSSERLIRRGQERLVVFGRLGEPPAQTVGVQVSKHEGTVAKIGGAFVNSLVELSQVFPVQVIEPGVHKLVEEGGHRRRRWMDWAVFHVEPGFADTWTRYTRALKQRNAALRTQPDQAGVWDFEIARLGEMLAESRRSFIEALQPYWQAAVEALTGLPVELHYYRGWGQDHSLAEALEASRSRDLAKGLSHVGPHRADVTLRIEGRPARDVLSRGQQKLVAVAMTLSQLRFLQDTSGTTPTLLLDDPAAEHDGERLRRFIEQVQQLRCQLVLTSLTPDVHLFGTPDRVFHVEQGRVQPVYNVAP